ncbi:hypothetical protein NPIL_449861 [Nephila pilipes]|uniref:Uncharacterized protein n=1 Tax=Nephila pilipes TaxID=299642 RepID=A0A8X6TPI2_NEPPI|nr:hypothetical protein NPIL_449861 [Nephila pilipes]
MAPYPLSLSTAAVIQLSAASYSVKVQVCVRLGSALIFLFSFSAPVNRAAGFPCTFNRLSDRIHEDILTICGEIKHIPVALQTKGFVLLPVSCVHEIAFTSVP